MSNKFNATKKECDGILFDSKFEMQVYQALKELESEKYISDVELQVPILLIPGFSFGIQSVRKMEMIVDFKFKYKTYDVYFESKGWRTDVYNLKLKLLKYIKKDLRKEKMFTYILYSGKTNKTVAEQKEKIIAKLDKELN